MLQMDSILGIQNLQSLYLMTLMATFAVTMIIKRYNEIIYKSFMNIWDYIAMYGCH